MYDGSDFSAGGGSVAQAVEHLGAVLPVPLHLDVQVEVGPLGEFRPHGGADGLEDLAPLADDDGLLGVALDEDLDSGCAATPTRSPGR